MTNRQKYKTKDIQDAEFSRLCLSRNCDECEYKHNRSMLDCYDEWLEEDDEVKIPIKIEPCPFCGSPCRMHSRMLMVVCEKLECTYQSAVQDTKIKAIKAHNELSCAVRAARRTE